jgi:hypothetical protein
MAIRETLNRHPALTLLVASIVLVGCIGMIMWQLSGEGPISAPDYYYEVSSGQIVAVSTDSKSKEADGQSRFKARIFACGQCRESYAGMSPQQIAEADAIVAYVERGPDDGGPAGYEVAHPAELDWVPAESNQGQAIMDRRPDCPSGQASYTVCFPNE